MASKRANSSASTRLRQDYLRIKKDPVPYIIGAEPLPSNILEWHYVIKGPEQSLYEGGYYHGKLVFPKDFPFKPPKIIMITPNGRFNTHTRLCLSISDFHPDTWNPSWSVSTILTGLLSFMLEKTATLGSIESSDYMKKRFASNSLAYNLKDKTFTELFPTICQEMKEIIEQQLEKENEQTDGAPNQEGEFLLPQDFNSGENNFINGTTFANICVFVGFAIFAVVVNYVVKAVASEDDL